MDGLIIRTYPDPILRRRSLEVARYDSDLKELIGSMVSAMYAQNGIGLAAVQIGILKRVIVIDTRGDLYIMINPVITGSGGRVSMEEGCLSVTGKTMEIERAADVSLSYLDETFQAVSRDFSGLTARAIQHEIDHLNGKLIIDYVPWYKRFLSKRGVKECLQ